jgi:hypothetical protein
VFFREHAGRAAGQRRRVVSVRAVESHPFVDKPDPGPWSLTHTSPPLGPLVWKILQTFDRHRRLRSEDVADQGSMPPPFEERCDLEAASVLGGQL